jgi:mercuric ion transport protein
MADIPTNSSTRAVGTGSVLLTFSGLAAAFGVASCCGLPFLLATAGLGTAWLTSFALLAAPHRSILLVVGAACLAGGGVLFWRQQRMAACTPGAFCSRPAFKSLMLTGLVVGLVLLYLGYAYA